MSASFFKDPAKYYIVLSEGFDPFTYWTRKELIDGLSEHEDMTGIFEATFGSYDTVNVTTAICNDYVEEKYSDDDFDIPDFIAEYATNMRPSRGGTIYGTGDYADHDVG